MQGYSAKSRVIPHTALQLLGTLYESPPAVIAEYIDNGADAGATTIWVVLEPDRIMVIDNGRGMVPDMSQDDRSLLDMYLEDIDDPVRGENLADFDIRSQLNPNSLSSLRWMIEYAAFSPKSPTESSKVRGVKGIGAIAFRQIADQAVWITRPYPDLAESYYGEGILKSVPTFKLVPPTAQMLQRHDRNNEVAETETIRDPFGNELSHGTRVELSSLKEGLKGLTPSALADYLGGRFGDDLRTGRFVLLIVDRLTDDGKKSAKGLEIYVQPPTYRGVLLVEKTGYLRGGKSPFEIKIYYDSKAVRLRPKLRRRGSEVSDITVISELNTEPWNSGTLGGYIDYPDLSDQEAPWSPDKRKPLPSPVFNQWLKSVDSAAEEVSARLAEIRDRAREERKRKLTSVVEKAITEAMLDLPAFKDLELLPPYVRREKVQRDKKLKRKPKDEARTLASVVNEHRQPVSGVELELIKAGQVLAKKLTGLTGTVSFGVLTQGRYTVRISRIPNKAKALGSTQETFNIGPNLIGAPIRFVLETGEPKPPQKKLPGIKIWLHDLDDLQPYSIERLQSLGFVEINTASPDYREAYDSGVEERLVLLESLYTAMAVTEFALQGDPRYLFAHAAGLFARAYSSAMEEKENLGKKRIRKSK